jgi:phosphoserine aminotransferase
VGFETSTTCQNPTMKRTQKNIAGLGLHVLISIRPHIINKMELTER